MQPAPPADYARPNVTLDGLLALGESGITVSTRLAEGAGCFQGHYPDYPIFPGVFTIEVVVQAARIFCEAYFPGGRLVRVGARFLAPVLPGNELLCRCNCKRLPEGERILLQGACSVDGRQVASVRLVFAREPTG